MPAKKKSATSTKADRPNERPADGREPMDEAAVRKALTEALSLQARSILELTLLGGALTGRTGLTVKASLRDFAAAEVRDTAALAEKLAALGGRPDIDRPTIDVGGTSRQALDVLLAHEREAIAQLHAVIADSGQEPRSEALEHLLEHVIMRKHQQVDSLQLALEESDGDRG